MSRFEPLTDFDRQVAEDACDLADRLDDLKKAADEIKAETAAILAENKAKQAEIRAKQAEVVVSSRLAGWPLEAIAETCRIPYSTVRNIVVEEASGGGEVSDDVREWAEAEIKERDEMKAALEKAAKDEKRKQSAQQRDRHIAMFGKKGQRYM